MTTDLWMLVASALLSVSIPFIYGTGRFQAPGGWEWALGNRDKPLPVPSWTDRAVRAHANLTENLGPFAILVLTAHVSGKANAMTALGATLFFIGRVAHVAIYTAGLVGLRTVAFFVGAVGEILILLQLF
jgi:uncharacterized MAPEG superfamily protein